MALRYGLSWPQRCVTPLRTVSMGASRGARSVEPQAVGPRRVHGLFGSVAFGMSPLVQYLAFQ